MNMAGDPKADTGQVVFALKHIETGEYICLLEEGNDYLACFSDGDTALEFRAELGLQEHVDIVACNLVDSPFTHLWHDGEMMSLPEFASV